MRLVITHTDLRIYWPSRILALQQALEQRGDELYTVEIAGAGSPYAFADQGCSSDESIKTRSEGIRNWICLFPTLRMEDIPPAQASRRLRRQLNELDPDVILCGAIAFPAGATAVYWAKTHGRCVVMFDDIRPENVPRNPLVNYIKRLLYGEIDAVLCPAPSWTAAFLHWKFRSEQLFFGVDVVDNAWWSVPAAQGPLPEGWAEWPAPFFIAVGRLIPAKNFLFLLRVYAQYRSLAPKGLPLVIIGDGPDRASLEKFITDSALKDVYLLPFVSQEKLRACYQHAAALVLPSLSETWGLVVNEAMAAGLPVLVSNECGCASVLVQEGINGYTFSPGRGDSLLALLLVLTAKDGPAREAMGRISQRIVHAWGLDRFVEGSLGAIQYALAHRKTCRSLRTKFVLQHWKGRYRPV